MEQTFYYLMNKNYILVENYNVLSSVHNTHYCLSKLLASTTRTH